MPHYSVNIVACWSMLITRAFLLAMFLQLLNFLIFQDDKFFESVPDLAMTVTLIVSRLHFNLASVTVRYRSFILARQWRPWTITTHFGPSAYTHHFLGQRSKYLPDPSSLQKMKKLWQISKHQHTWNKLFSNSSIWFFLLFPSTSRRGFWNLQTWLMLTFISLCTSFEIENLLKDKWFAVISLSSSFSAYDSLESCSFDLIYALLKTDLLPVLMCKIEPAWFYYNCQEVFSWYNYLMNSNIPSVGRQSHEFLLDLY